MNNENPITADLRAQLEAAGDDGERAEIRAGIEGAAAFLREIQDGEPLPGETWKAADPPPRDWLIPDWIPAGRLAAVYGTGASGKSMMALQIAAAVMHGGPPLRPAAAVKDKDGLIADHKILQPVPETSTGKVLWLTWEDEIDEIVRRWRMAYHAGAIGIPYPDPSKLTLVDMRAVGGALWEPKNRGHFGTGAAWSTAGRRFVKTLADHKFAIVDPLAAAYASSEIERALVRAFTSAIDGAAEEAGCAVLLIAHPSVSGKDRGSSGSTDWQASVRAHFVLESSDETAHVFDGDDAKKPTAAEAYRIVNAKQSYAVDGGWLWLARDYRPADGATPTRLAWFAAPAGVAAQSFEDADARKRGRKPREVSSIEAAKKAAKSAGDGAAKPGDDHPAEFAPGVAW